MTDNVGDPVADASYSVVFTIYDAAVVGSSVWTETQNVNTTDGAFAVLLGSINPILDTVFNKPDRYLGIAVENDPELTPRVQLVSVGYALRVNTVDGSTGGVISGDVSIQSDLTVSGEIGSDIVRAVAPSDSVEIGSDIVRAVAPLDSAELGATGVRVIGPTSLVELGAASVQFLDSGGVKFIELNENGLVRSSDGSGTGFLEFVAHDGTRIYSDSGMSSGVNLKTGAGSWSSLSDRNKKENLESVNVQDLLEKVAALPITTWNYKTQDEAIRHIGPMTQDFYAAFGVGEDDKYITTIDADGVALAAIKALYEKSKRVDALEQSNELLEKEMIQLRLLVEQLLSQNKK